MKRFAKDLLRIKAVKIQPSEPFSWASGWTSPFYCDNRKCLSHPEIRTYLKLEVAHLISTKYQNIGAIAGVATGAISMAALVADLLNLPMIYVRTSKKDHGMKNQIEGEIPENKNIVVIEDLISTGSSSLNAVEALRDADCNVLGMVAQFTYGFPQAKEAFVEAGCELTTVTDYTVLIEAAIEAEYILPEDIHLLEEWRTHPDTWTAPQ